MIIGLAGKKGVGKSTAASALDDMGFEVMSFAYTLKLMSRILMRDCGLTEDQIIHAYANKEEIIPVLGVSYRHLCQTLGTEWGRQHIHPDLWVIAAKHRAGRAIDHVVFDDVRFENEAAMIRNCGGLVIHIYRDSFDSDGHASEAGIKVADCDVVINNDGDEGDLFNAVTVRVDSWLLERANA